MSLYIWLWTAQDTSSKCDLYSGTLWIVHVKNSINNSAILNILQPLWEILRGCVCVRGGDYAICSKGAMTFRWQRLVRESCDSEVQCLTEGFGCHTRWFRNDECGSTRGDVRSTETGVRIRIKRTDDWETMIEMDPQATLEDDKRVKKDRNVIKPKGYVDICWTRGYTSA